MTPADDAEPVEAPNAGGAGSVCPECGDSFANNGIRGIHMRREHGIEGTSRKTRARRDRQPTAKAGGARPARPSRAKRPSLEPELTVAYGLMAQFWAMRDPVCGQVALQAVPGIAKSWDQLAAGDPRIYDVMVRLMRGSSYLNVAMAHAPILAVVAAHHGPNRAQYFGEPAGPEQAADNGTGGPGPGEGPQVSSEPYGPYSPGAADRAR